MIFEVPVDHFPIVASVKADRRRPHNLRSSAHSQPSMEPLSAAAERTQFSFPSVAEKLPTSMRANIPQLKRAFTSPTIPATHLRQAAAIVAAAAVTPSSSGSRTSSVSDLLKIPSRILSSAVSLHQLA
ncbi:unnamed protein product [Caenorhabditis auriculariae]|uniref:Uncharacterized protein n=1 Tax=Caenorhabditis auriculariae TaxID=2777116 RepID=A0A8S1H2W8_9PELO|nr:unnamed protein product [Caenorhabditis auriculariae]